MLTRKIVDYKIKEKRPELFVKLGNVFPQNSLFYHLFYDYNTGSFRDIGKLIYNVLGSTSKYYIEQISWNYISNNKAKTISNYLSDIVDNYQLGKYFSDDYYTVNINAFNTISSFITSKYYDKWTMISKALYTNYDIIKPFSIAVDEEGEERKSGGTTSTVKSSGKDNSSENSSSYEGTNSTVSNDQTDNYTFGFNSGEAVPTDISKNNSRTSDYTNTTDDSDSTTTMSREKTDNFIDNRVSETIRNIVRKGNIGNMSYQDLITKEVKLREYVLIDMIYDDLNGVLTRSKYIIGE